MSADRRYLLPLRVLEDCVCLRFHCDLEQDQPMSINGLHSGNGSNVRANLIEDLLGCEGRYSRNTIQSVQVFLERGEPFGYLHVQLDDLFVQEVDMGKHGL